MIEVKVPEDADRCEGLLTPEQRQELANELARELDAAGVQPEMESGKPAAKPRPKADAPKKAADPKRAPAAAPAPPPAKASGRPGGSGEGDPCKGGE